MSNTFRIILISLATLFNLVTVASTANILFLVPSATKSETHLLNPMAKAMLARGHKVTLVTPASSSIKHSNFTEVVPTQPLTLSDFDLGSSGNVLDMRRGKDDLSGLLYMDMSCVYDKCHETYKHKDFAQVIEAKTYDLVLTSAFFSECFLPLIHKLKAPFIFFCSMPLPQEVLDLTGLRTPLSFVPNPDMAFTDKMSLSERLINTLSSWSYTLLNQYHFHKISENVAKQYLGEDIPSVELLRRNVSLIFSNTHFSLNYPRPSMPDVVEIGGVHTQVAKPLPKDLEEFCSGGKHGFILFSFGTVIPEKMFPESLINVFINVFSRLKTRVLWKWQSELKGLSSNVRVSKWLPQQDVLGHPNIKLFISHGGLLSTQEATYHGLPILGIPLFGDQDVNMKQAESHGYALKLELLNMTEDSLEHALHRMLNDTSFSDKAKLASEIFRDQPQTPLERAVYWMEYVVKWKGAPQLRSSARDLSYFEYHMYDISLILLSILGGLIYLAWKIISTLLGCLGCGWSKRGGEKIAKNRFAKKNQ